MKRRGRRRREGGCRRRFTQRGRDRQNFTRDFEAGVVDPKKTADVAKALRVGRKSLLSREDRGRSEVHKRLMVVATVVLLISALARWAFVGSGLARPGIWLSPIECEMRRAPRNL